LSRYPYAQDEKPLEAHVRENEGDVELRELATKPGNYDIDELDVTYLTTVVSIDNAIYDVIRNSYKDDSFFKPIITNPERYPTYTVTDGLIYHRDRLCIPNERETREMLLATHHDDQNHFGAHKTQAAITRDYLWPGLTKDVDAYIKSCDPCIRKKSTTQAPVGFLHPLPVPSARFREIAMDFIGPLPRSCGFDMAILITDRLTDYVKIEPTNTTATAPEIANLFYRTWYRQFGLPSAITSDRDKLFMSRFWKELMKKVDVHLRMSTAYHPETDGSSERSNKTAIEAIRQYVNVRQTDWADHLIHVETAMNNSINATTKMTPTELLYGTPLRLFPHPTDASSKLPSVTEFIERINESVAIAQDNHTIAKTRQATQANKHQRAEPTYKVGDKAYLSTKNLRLKVKKTGRCTKFHDRYVGPFPIIKTFPDTSTYKLQLPDNYKIHPTFHARLLRPEVANNPELFPNREPARPGPAYDDDDEEYEIEKILDHKDTRHGREYLVHWLGWPTSDDQWIPEADLHAPDLLAEYNALIATPHSGSEEGGVQGQRPSRRRKGKQLG
jgi:hypothetical protein